MNKPLIGITVSVNLNHILVWSMAINLRHFQKWYIITDASDGETLKLCREADSDVVEILTHNILAEDVIFDKGGALGMGQQVAHRRHPDAAFLILDADVLLPGNFMEYLHQIRMEENTLYGVEARYDFATMHDLRNYRYSLYKYGDQFTGFFQLYGDTSKYYLSSDSIDRCDDHFRSLFSTKVYIEGLYVHHLGSSGLGARYLTQEGVLPWNGRMPDLSFEIDEAFSQDELEYVVRRHHPISK